MQQGALPSDWKPLPSVGAGVAEIRIHTAIEHRVLYVANYQEAVYVLHAFEKKTRRTPRRELAIARARLAMVIEQRRPAARSRKDEA